MASFLFAEHQDFDKCRRTFFGSSTALAVTALLKFESSHVEVFKLKFAVDHEKIVAFAAVSTVYFAIIFGIKVFEQLPKMLNERMKLVSAKSFVEVNKSIQEDLESFFGEYKFLFDEDSRQNDAPLNSDAIEILREEVKSLCKNVMSNYNRNTKILKFTYILSEIVPPYFVATVAFIIVQNIVLLKTIVGSIFDEKWQYLSSYTCPGPKK